MSFHPDDALARDPARYRVTPPGPSPFAPGIAAEIDRSLAKASRIQQTLADSREELLIEREILRSSSESLRAQRIESADREVAFMNALRQYVTQRNETLPSKLTAIWNDVQAARDKLGVMEVDYLQADRTHSGLEWTFMDKENDVYQFDFQDVFTNIAKIITAPPNEIQRQPPAPPSPPIEASFSPPAPTEEQLRTAKATFDASRKEFDSVRRERARHIDMQSLPRISNPDMITDYAPHIAVSPENTEVLKNLIESELNVQRLKQQLTQRKAVIAVTSLDPVTDRRMSDPADFKKTHRIPFDVITRAQTESALSMHSNDLETRRKILKWLRDYSKIDVIQRFYHDLMNEYGVNSSDDGDWEGRDPDFWSSDDSGQSRKLVQHKPALTYGNTEQHDLRANAESDTITGNKGPTAARTKSTSGNSVSLVVNDGVNSPPRPSAEKITLSSSNTIPSLQQGPDQTTIKGPAVQISETFDDQRSSSEHEQPGKQNPNLLPLPTQDPLEGSSQTVRKDSCQESGDASHLKAEPHSNWASFNDRKIEPESTSRPLSECMNHPHGSYNHSSQTNLPEAPPGMSSPNDTRRTEKSGVHNGQWDPGECMSPSTFPLTSSSPEPEEHADPGDSPFRTTRPRSEGSDPTERHWATGLRSTSSTPTIPRTRDSYTGVEPTTRADLSSSSRSLTHTNILQNLHRHPQ